MSDSNSIHVPWINKKKDWFVEHWPTSLVLCLTVYGYFWILQTLDFIGWGQTDTVNGNWDDSVALKSYSIETIQGKRNMQYIILSWQWENNSV